MARNTKADIILQLKVQLTDAQAQIKKLASEVEGLTKQLEKQKSSEAAAQEAARQAADAIEQSRRRDLATLEQLNEELEEYRQLLVQSEQSGDQKGRLNSLKNIGDLEKRINALAAAQKKLADAEAKANAEAEKLKKKEELLLEQTDKLADSQRKAANSAANMSIQAGKAAAKTSNMGMGVLSLAQTLDDLQYGIRGVVNNIPGLVMSLGGSAGLAGVLGMAAVGVNLLMQYIDKLNEKEKKQAEERKERLKNYCDQLKAVDDAVKEYNQTRLEDKIASSYEQEVKRIYELQKEITAEIEEQINLRAIAVARENGLDSKKAELDLLNLETAYENKEITKEEYRLKKFMIQQSLLDRTRERESEQLYKDRNNKQSIVSNAESTAAAESRSITALKSLEDSLPEIREIQKTLKSMGEAQADLPDLKKEEGELLKTIFQTREQISNIERYDFANLRNINTLHPRDVHDVYSGLKKKLADAEKKLLELSGRRADAESIIEHGEGKISGINEIFKKFGVSFHPNWQNPESAIEKYGTAREKVEEKLSKREEEHQANLKSIEVKKKEVEALNATIAFKEKEAKLDKEIYNAKINQLNKLNKREIVEAGEKKDKDIRESIEKIAQEKIKELLGNSKSPALAEKNEKIRDVNIGLNEIWDIAKGDLKDKASDGLLTEQEKAQLVNRIAAEFAKRQLSNNENITKSFNSSFSALLKAVEGILVKQNQVSSERLRKEEEQRKSQIKDSEKRVLGQLK